MHVIITCTPSLILPFFSVLPSFLHPTITPHTLLPPSSPTLLLSSPPPLLPSVCPGDVQAENAALQVRVDTMEQDLQEESVRMQELLEQNVQLELDRDRRYVILVKQRQGSQGLPVCSWRPQCENVGM